MKRRNNKTAQNKKKKNPKNRNSNVNESNPFLEKKEACHYCHRFYTHAYMSRHVLYHCRDSPHYLPPAPAPPLHNKVDKPPPLHVMMVAAADKGTKEPLKMGSRAVGKGSKEPLKIAGRPTTKVQKNL
jgi:hypothetical protein